MTITMSEQVDAEPCDVLRGGDGPVYFLLGGRLYVVHEVLGRWIEPDVEPRRPLRPGPRTIGGSGSGSGSGGGDASGGGGRGAGAGTGATAGSDAGVGAGVGAGTRAGAGAVEGAALTGSDDPSVPTLPRARSGGGEKGAAGTGRHGEAAVGGGGAAGVQATGAGSTGQSLTGAGSGDAGARDAESADAYSSGARSGRAQAYGARSNASEQSEPPQVEHWLVVASVGRYGTPAVFRLQRRPAPPSNGPDTWTVRAERR